MQSVKTFQRTASKKNNSAQNPENKFTATIKNTNKNRQANHTTAHQDSDIIGIEIQK